MCARAGDDVREPGHPQLVPERVGESEVYGGTQTFCSDLGPGRSANVIAPMPTVFSLTTCIRRPLRDPAEKGRVRFGIGQVLRPRNRRRIRRLQGPWSDERCVALPGSVRPTGVAIFVLVASCGLSDPPPPWDTHQMVSELTSELRQFEGLATNFDQVEVLVAT